MAASDDSRIRTVRGRLVPVRGDDIDTDRIIPARFLRCVTFDGIEAHAFEDDRAQLRAAGRTHAFDDPRFTGAAILLVNRNFGCGSSREHAPQAIGRWGIRAIVGESFAEIFFGNCVALGVPCLTAAPADVEKLMASAEADPAAECEVDLDRGRVVTPGGAVPAALPPGPRDAFLEGTWDATGLLVRDFDEVRGVAARLPYMAASWRGE